MENSSFEKAEVSSTVEEVKTIFSGKNPYKMLTSYTFLDFVKFNEDRLIKTFYSVAKAIPSTMRSEDYRMLISDMFARTLDRDFYQLKDNKAIGYDLIYNNYSRISLKSIQKGLFQRPKLRGKGLTKPTTIVLKNKLSAGKNSTDAGIYCDYLLGVSAFYDKKEGCYVLSFGVTPFDVVKEYIPKKSSGDQVKVAIPNEKWAFISKTFKIHDPKTSEKEERKNNVLNTGLDNIYFELQRI